MSDNGERKTFQSLPYKENEHFLTDGKEIYLNLKYKYGTDSVEGLDSILNILLCSLICLMKMNVNPDNRKIFIQLVHKVLTSNLQDQEDESKRN